MPRGRKRFPWIKLWFDILGDPKMSRLSSAEKWYWTGILLLAGQSPIRGKLMLTDTEPMSIEDIAAALSLHPKEMPLLESCITKLEKLRSVAWNSVCLEVIHFKDRQEVYESDFKDYHKGESNKFRNNSELPPDKVLKEVEGRGEGQKKDSSPNGEEIYSQKPADEIKELFDLWNSLGVIKHKKLTGDMTRAIKAALRDFSAAEISQAMKNYAHIVNDERYYFEYKWRIEDFAKRGFKKFLDLEVAQNNYRKGGAGGVDKRHPGSSKPEGKWDTSKPLPRKQGKRDIHGPLR